MSELENGQKLSQIEQDILNKSYGLGNDILYNLCENMHLSQICKNSSIFHLNKNSAVDYSAKEALSAQLWLIGRSYAASPERRNYTIKSKDKNDEFILWLVDNKNKDKEKLHLSNSGDGLDTYFDYLAEEILENTEINNIIKKLNKTTKYSFSKFEEDINTLINAVSAVLEMNKLLKEARYSIDEKDIKEYTTQKFKRFCQTTKDYSFDEKLDNSKIKNIWERSQNNAISFCSKFLHFHYPNLVFIMDSLTKAHFKREKIKCECRSYIFSFKKQNGESEKSCINIEESSENKCLDLLKKAIETADEKEREYIRHCVREYLLAKKINDKYTFGEKYVPRLIDTYMLIANSK